VSERTQYGDLMRIAGSHILAANVTLDQTAFGDAEQGRQALAAYADLLHALAGHGRQLFGSDTRLRAIRGTNRSDPREVAAALMVDQLSHLGVKDLGDGGAVVGAARSWREAASAMRAASDLLGTYRDPSGVPQTPTAALLYDLSIRTAGFGELASLTLPVNAAAGSLGQQLEQVGFTKREVEHLVPETRHLAEAARGARRVVNLGGVGLRLARLVVAKPSVRRQDPALELRDRLERLHRLAWQLTQEDWVGICTLADLAVAGVLVNQRAAALSVSPAGLTDLSARRVRAGFEQGAEAWHEVHGHLRELRTATPALPALRTDVVVVRDLLDKFGRGSEDPSLRQVISEGATRFGEIANWSLEVLEQQVATRRVMVPGHFLSGNQVSDEPMLVRAKLKNLLAPVPTGHLQPLAKAYRSAETAVSRALVRSTLSVPELSL